MAEDVDYMAVASMTDGMVGAELANIIEVAAITMLRDNRSEVILFLKALDFDDFVKPVIMLASERLQKWEQISVLF